MPVTVVQTTQDLSTDYNNVILSLATAPTPGNLLVMAVATYSSQTLLSPPSGWNRVAISGAGSNFTWWTRIVQVNDPQTWTFAIFNNGTPANTTSLAASMWELHNGVINDAFPSYGVSNNAGISGATALIGTCLQGDLPLFAGVILNGGEPANTISLTSTPTTGVIFDGSIGP